MKRQVDANTCFFASLFLYFFARMALLNIDPHFRTFTIKKLKFTDFNFDARLLDGIEASNYDTATPVQEQVIPHIY